MRLMKLPVIPAGTASEFLIFCLTSISERSRARLVAVIDEAIASNVSKPAKRPVFAYRDSSKSVQGGDAGSGSIADIFNLACLARDFQWNELAVVDALSVRQLEARTRYGEDTDLTFVVVGTRHSAKRQRGVSDWDEQKSVIALRKSKIDTIMLLKSNTPCVKLRPMLKPGVRHKEREMEWYERGLIIHDPSSPVYTKDKEVTSIEAPLVQAAMDKAQHLPAEIRFQIMENLKEEKPLDQLTAAPLKLMWKAKILEIHVLCHLSKTDHQSFEQSIQSIIEKLDPNASCILYSWLSFEPANRYDFYRLWQRLVDNNKHPPYMLAFLYFDPNSWRSDGQLGMVKYDFGSPLAARKVDLKTAILTWQAILEGTYERNSHTYPNAIEDLDANGTGELILNPASPFFSDRPAWKEHPDAEHTAPPVFFLTNKFSERELKRLEVELYTVDAEFGDDEDEDSKQYTFVPWRGEKDATEEDMWEMFQECISYQGGREGYSQIICIDRRSFQDKTVLLVDAWYNSNDPEDFDGSDDSVHEDDEDVLKGMRYGRCCGRHVHIAWVNLNIANMDLEDFVPLEKTEYYVRYFHYARFCFLQSDQGYPVHYILADGQTSQRISETGKK